MASVSNPLLQKFADQWHPTKNGTLKPTDVSAGSNKKVWWLGACGHEWEMTPNNIQKSKGCPVCSGKIILPGFNDLPTLFPELAEEWHPIKNTIDVTAVFKASNTKVWWLGKCGHEWEQSPNARTRSGNGAGCPVCAGKQVEVGFNDFASQQPELAKEWHPTNNGDLLPEHIAEHANRKVWWLGQCGHEWEAKVSNRVSLGRGCPVCVGQKIVAGENDFQTFHPELAKEWHPTKNGELNPTDVSPKSNQKVWWLAECHHEWEATVANRANGTNCPYCSGGKISKGLNDLASNHPELAQEFDLIKNAPLTPETVNAGSGKSYWWVGKDCGHSWETRISHRINGAKCPVCANKQVLVGYNDLATTHPTILTDWHPTLNVDVTPQDITFGSEKKIWWICKKGHVTSVSVCDRAGTRRHGCKFCSTSISKAEQEIADFIRNNGLDIIQSDRKALPGMELDINVPAKKFAIEFNGLYWHTERAGKGRTYHYNKWKAAQNADIQLVQIWEDEWRRNPEQVKRMLLHKLGLSVEEKVFARKTSAESVSKNDVEGFFETNHIQGFSTGSHYAVLKDSSGNIVAGLILRKLKDGIYDIVRYATSKNVVGGFTKLLSYSVKQLNPERLITFSDNCVSDGGLYENNGFVADKEVRPDYKYVVNGERKHKFGYRLKRFESDPELQWVDGFSETQLAALNCLERIWDAGKTRWVKDL